MALILESALTSLCWIRDAFAPTTWNVGCGMQNTSQTTMCGAILNTGERCDDVV